MNKNDYDINPLEEIEELDCVSHNTVTITVKHIVRGYTYCISHNTYSS